ncbi:MAG: hypothetical protein OEW19_22520 [Acidobacteriota bacterium]|nr:hypothetical protein [Acidobacteriota bacterium]
MGALDAAVRLNASLDEVAAALVAPDADALLSAEAGLASVLAELSDPPTAGDDDPARVAAEVAQARATLARCRILGAAIADASRIALVVQGHTADYTRTGGPTSATTADGTRGNRLRARL